MAFSPGLRQKLKAIILALIFMCLFDLAIFIYYDTITIPYLSPAVHALGNALYPFTPIITPVIVYFNLKQWRHPGWKAFRATLTRRQYISTIIPQYVAGFMIIFCISLKVPWVVEKLYGLEIDDGMCVGPCWKSWTELGLLVFVFIAVFMHWDLDGGAYDRFLDRQIEKLKQKDAEKAMEEAQSDEKMERC
ncbi:hypothetical protein F5884DRAFT_83784 [Xylogone sp. PMI_703]|nr:hypothetical protein F5884DRAFT_83784 [Xylogone sp. PMI_703]